MAAKTQQTNDVKGGMRSYLTAEFVKPEAPGWRVPLVNLAYSHFRAGELYKSLSQLTYGLAAVAAEHEYVVPVVRRRNEFLVGDCLEELIAAAGLSDGGYVDVWQTTAVKDYWENKVLRRRVEGEITRVHIGPEGRYRLEEPRPVLNNLTVSSSELERYGVSLSEILPKCSPVPISEGCLIARSVRKERNNCVVGHARMINNMMKDTRMLGEFA